MNEEVKNIVDEDREKYPDCNYSYNEQKSSRTVNGNTVREVMNRVSRHCPGNHPVEIYSNSTTENSDKQPSWTGAIGDRMLQGLGDFAMSRMLDSLNKSVRDLEGKNPKSQFPFEKWNDDGESTSNNDDRDSEKKKLNSVKGQISGPGERI
jgi:hypothetical protein